MDLLAFSVASFSSENCFKIWKTKSFKLTTGAGSGDFSFFEKLTASDFKSVLISRKIIQYKFKHDLRKIKYLVVMGEVSHPVNQNIYWHSASFDFHFVETWRL